MPLHILDKTTGDILPRPWMGVVSGSGPGRAGTLLLRVSWWDGDDGKWKCREAVTATKRESRGPTKPAPTKSIPAGGGAFNCGKGTQKK